MRLVPMVFLVACGPSLPDELGSLFTETGGCGDVVFFAVDSGDAFMLSVVAEDLVSEAFTNGTTTTTFQLPDDEIVVQIEVGSSISDAMCDDVIENDGPQVKQTFTGTSGTATITVRPGSDPSASRADLLLESIGFESGGETRALEALSIDGVTVGWFAG